MSQMRTSVQAKKAAHPAVKVGLAILVVLVIAVLALFGVRWSGAANTVRSFVQADWAATSAADAAQREYPLLCADVQAQLPESVYASRLESRWDANEGAVQNVDIAALTYTTQSETLTEAQVRLTGYLTYTHNGQAGTYTYDPSAPGNLHTLRTSGLGWCLTADMLAPGILS